jgi:hypothetical protein
MDEIKRFLDECRADLWFQSRPGLIDRLEIVLTNFYLLGPAKKRQGIRVRAARRLRARENRIAQDQGILDLTGQEGAVTSPIIS